MIEIAKIAWVIILIRYILFSALLGAFIGWVTNIVAIKLIFRPYKAINILGLFTLQGVLPKRKNELAIAIGQTVEQELLSSEEIFQYLQNPQLQEKVTKGVITSVKERIEKYVPNIIPGIRETITGILDKVIVKEVDRYFRETFPKTCKEIENSLPIAKLIEEKVNQLDFRELERIVIAIAQRELKHIEVLGGILGFIIGLIQGIISYLILT